MGYYRGGDYYRGGGYYRAGGIFGDIFHAVTGTVGGAIKGFVSGGPLGAIGGAIGGAVGATRRNIANQQVVDTGGPSAYTPAMRAAHNRVLIRQHANVALPAMAAAGSTNGGGGGGFGGGRRHMRVTNLKALTRATRRIKGFEKHAKRALGAVGLHIVRHVPKKAGRFGGRR